MAKETIVSRNSLTVKTLGDPKKVLGMDAPNARHLVGTIFGVATAVKSKVVTDNKTGNTTVYEPIMGQFEGIPSVPVDGEDGDKITGFRSGVLYLPSGIHEQLAQALKEPDAKPIKFAVEVYTVKANNLAGYTYEAKALFDVAVADPLAEMRKSLVGHTKLLPGPKAPPAADGKKAA